MAHEMIKGREYTYANSDSDSEVYKCVTILPSGNAVMKSEKIASEYIAPRYTFRHYTLVPFWWHKTVTYRAVQDNGYIGGEMRYPVQEEHNIGHLKITKTDGVVTDIEFQWAVQ